ncbi:hypothetical protein FRC15_005292, partial [Serendipita sp. 397]
SVAAEESLKHTKPINRFIALAYKYGRHRQQPAPSSPPPPRLPPPPPPVLYSCRVNNLCDIQPFKTLQNPNSHSQTV